MNDWLKVPRGYIKAFGAEAAVLLAELVDLYEWSGKNDRRKDGYCRLTTKGIVDRTGLSEGRLKRNLRRLEAAKVIKRRLLGMPAKRYFKVREQRISAILQLVLLGQKQPDWGSLVTQLMGQKQPICKVKVLHREGTEKASKLKNGNSPQTISIQTTSSSGGVRLTRRGKEKVDERYGEMAKELTTALGSVRKINRTSDPGRWWWWFRKLHTTAGIDIAEIQETLRWYCQAIDEHGDIIANGNHGYLPVIRSGKAFYEKYEKVRDAMARERVKRGDEEEEMVEEREARPMKLIKTGLTHKNLTERLGW